MQFIFNLLQMTQTQRNNRKAFFLRHTARLPSSTSQLVWSLHLGVSSSTTTFGGGGGVLFHYHFQGGSSSTTTSRGSSSTNSSGGVLFHYHFWGVPFHYHFQVGSSSTTTSEGSPVTYPIMLLYNAIEHPSASWAKFTWDPPA